MSFRLGLGHPLSFTDHNGSSRVMGEKWDTRKQKLNVLDDNGDDYSVTSIRKLSNNEAFA